MTEQPSTISFNVLTAPGDGTVRTDSFKTPEARLESLRQRAQEYFPGSSLPTPRGEHSEDAYLAQLLGFFLMLSDGSVTLTQGEPATTYADPLRTSSAS